MKPKFSKQDLVKERMIAKLPSLFRKACKDPQISDEVSNLINSLAQKPIDYEDDPNINIMKYNPLFGHIQEKGYNGKKCWVWKVVIGDNYPLWVVRIIGTNGKYELRAQKPKCKIYHYQP